MATPHPETPLNPFSIFASPTTLNPFSFFFGNTAVAPSPSVIPPASTSSTVESLVPTTTPVSGNQ